MAADTNSNDTAAGGYGKPPRRTQFKRFCRVNCKKHRGWTSVYAAPRTWANLSCQRIELIGKRHLVAILDHELAFANHVHEFDARQDISG